MVDKTLFTKTLRTVMDIARHTKEGISREEIASYFEGMELSKEQKEMVYQYLQHPDTEASDTKQVQPDAKRKGQQRELELPKTAFFQMYLKDLRQIQSVTQQEEEELYIRLVEGDEAAVRQLSDQWLSRVLQIARRRATSARDLSDVIQEGNMGVFLALNELLGSKKRLDYQAVLTKAVEESMDAYILGEAGHQDLTSSLLAKAALVHEAQKALAEDLQRMPTMQELSHYTRLSEEERKSIQTMAKETGIEK